MTKKRQKSVSGKDAAAARPTRERSWVAIDTVPSPEHPPFHRAEPDPVPSWYLLDKTNLAQLKISRLDAAIADLEKQIELCKIERDLLKKEYRLK
ncbi:MAG: hypothetical protein HWN69_06895 [Desulfobacterales bacterium]|nr:hypothetical protein [Desulfobacterales bacterium]